MTFTEAAVEVLRLVGKPLHYKKITEIAIERNLLSHVGKTPEITMSARLATMVKKDRGEAPIVKVKPGVFGLRDFTDDVIQAAEGEPIELSEEELAIAEGAVEIDEEEDAAADGGEAAAPAEAKPARRLPGAEFFPEEEDDDEPILANLDQAEGKKAPAGSDEDDERGGRRKRRRRRRRKGGEGGEVVEARERGERDRPERDRGGRDRDRDRDRGRERDRGRDRDRDDRRRHEPHRVEVTGDWDREPAEGELVGKDLADAIEAVLDGGPHHPSTYEQIAHQLVRRGRLTGDAPALVPTVAAAVRGDIARRQAKNGRPRFRVGLDGRVALADWSLPNDAVRAEQEATRSAERQRDLARRAFVRRIAELPTAGLMELLATWLNAEGVTALRGVRRPGAAPGEFHLAGVQRRGPEEIPLAIVVVRDGGGVGRERVIDVRGALHHYGNAAAAWIISLGQVLSGARDEAAVSGAAPVALFDGVRLARAMEEVGVGLRRHVVHVVSIDIDLLESLGAGVASRRAEREPDRRREERPPARDSAPELEELDEELEGEELDEEGAGEGEEIAAAGEASGEPAASSEDPAQAEREGRRRRRRRRRGRRGGAGAEAQPAEATAGAAEDLSDEEPILGGVSESDEEEIDVEVAGEEVGEARAWDEDDDEEVVSARERAELEVLGDDEDDDDVDEEEDEDVDEDDDEDEDDEELVASDEGDDEDDDDDPQASSSSR